MFLLPEARGDVDWEGDPVVDHREVRLAGPFELDRNLEYPKIE